MKHIEEIQELPNRNGFMISVVTEFGAVHETWFYNEVKNFKLIKIAKTLVITDQEDKMHHFKVYGDVTENQIAKIYARLLMLAITFRPANPWRYQELGRLCKRMASH